MKTNPGVLIIDDDLGVQQALASTLRETCSVSVASCGEEGLQQFERAHPDVILLDLMLPNMGGIAVLRRLKKLSHDVPVIMMTAYAQVQTAVEAIKLGATDYIEKPFDPDHLINRVNSLVAARSHPRLSARNGIVGESPAIHRVWRMVERFAVTNVPILLQGETGTGKGAFARAIHELSKRSQQPFIDVDCGTIPEQLAESELFGYEDGAFTGAGKRKIGRVAFADKGTLFLDEIGVLTMASQAKLLTVVEQQRFVPLGARDGRARQVDIRFVSATNVPLKKAIENGTFREDLYHRLDGITIELPPLRERPGDIDLLVEHFLADVRMQHGNYDLQCSSESLQLLREYQWPGNVRELQRVVTASAVMSGGLITPDDLPSHLRVKQAKAAAAAAGSAPSSSQSLAIAIQAGAQLNLGRIKECGGP